MIWRSTRGDIASRFNKIRDTYLDVSKETKNQIDREHTILEAYRDFRGALKQAEVMALDLPADSSRRRDVIRGEAALGRQLQLASAQVTISEGGRALTLEAIRVLDAIDRRGSFAAAADELGKVPSALSYTVQKLEDELDAMLFDRSGHRTKFTPAGRMLLEQGRLLLEAAEHLVGETRALARGWETDITIAVDALVPLQALYPLVERLAEHFEERLEVAGFFFPPTKAAGMRLNLRNMWARLGLTRAEVQTFHGMLRQIAWKLRQQGE